jgi:hypothetical protein
VLILNCSKAYLTWENCCPGSKCWWYCRWKSNDRKPELFKVAILESGVLNTTRFDNNGIQETSMKEYGSPMNQLNLKDY